MQTNALVVLDLGNPGIFVYSTYIYIFIIICKCIISGSTSFNFDIDLADQLTFYIFIHG